MKIDMLQVCVCCWIPAFGACQKSIKVEGTLLEHTQNASHALLHHAQGSPAPSHKVRVWLPLHFTIDTITLPGLETEVAHVIIYIETVR